MPGMQFTEGDHAQGISSGWRGLLTDAILTLQMGHNSEIIVSRGEVVCRHHIPSSVEMPYPNNFEC